MGETPESIRQQMDETRLQLNEKLETLELQVAETVQSTGTAVNATVEVVQETVHSVSGVVQNAVHSVSDAFDLGLQIERHPLIVLGGAVVLGYFASEFFTMNAVTSKQLRQAAPALPLFSGRENVAAETVATPTAVAACESVRATSSWIQLRDVTFGLLIGVVQEIASRSVPRIVDYVTGDSAGTEPRDLNKPEEQPEFTDGAKSFDDGHHFRIASSGSARMRKPF